MNFPLSVSRRREMAENQSNSSALDFITGQPGGSVGRANDYQIRESIVGLIPTEVKDFFFASCGLPFPY